MKRRDLERHLRLHSCVLLREGAKHSVFTNVQNGNDATIPRHTEIWPGLARAICKQLDIPAPRGK
ncbi:addiction module toxin, HicA family [Candidatus Kaiserbacteria bacterium CG10_big_fil_rev_8_21_14_0_10_51_14]|uniref:Addiction module toxin, HicA family n=1 Tax=Candidatus Kaiserbacteria bacterium CG10_big_fil_rev_8_21_14_0_10_51_14 TaxID=1974610 RepID=A0A2H0UD54_9BACT|nr:MAG: addiction module toxin, HicA family [Candidatus Kaiserbacteria bacterium CG10_big_fil_rev_8_21_14_0_10_51_14]